MIRLALPTADLRKPLAALLSKAGIDVPGYGEGSRSYRFAAGTRDEVAIRVFRERDVPVQIALGNYDIGICGAAEVEELTSRFPQSSVLRLGELDVGRRTLYAAAADAPPPQSGATPSSNAPLRIASEYGNLAEAFALALRLRAYQILPLWGSAHVYPPEDAEIALVSVSGEDVLHAWGLRPIASLLEGGATVITNRERLAAKDLSPVLAPLSTVMQTGGNSTLRLPRRVDGLPAPRARRTDVVRLAVPDGHQQPDAVAALRDAGIALDGYDADRCETRPKTDIDGLEVKVIRPQDMPQQAALGSFDLAITGRDWLFDHTVRFPSSPARLLVDLGRCRYSLVATVSEDVAGESLHEALGAWRGVGNGTVRVASEYMNLADHYAQEWHLGRYQVIPIAGASEGFVPEDADILIEGTETGSTLAANRLKIVEQLFESTSHLIGHAERPDGTRADLIEKLVRRFSDSAVPAGSGG